MAGTVSAWAIDGGSVHSRMEDEVFVVYYDVVADSLAATIPDQTINLEGMSVAGISAVFDGTTPPDSLKVDVLDKFGVTIATATLTATGYTAMEPIKFGVGPFTVSHSTNTTNSAEAKIILTVF